MHGIDVSGLGSGLLVELCGEFDVFCMEELKGALDEASSCRGPVLVDLSGITFIDLCSARELALRSTPGPGQPTFVYPSSQVMATMSAIGIGCRSDVRPDPGSGVPQVFSRVS